MKASVPQRHVIVACHAWYQDSAGGSFRLASEFAEYLAAQGHLVSYVCCAKDADWNGPVEEVINGVHVYRYRPASTRQSGVGRLRFHLRETRRLSLAISIKDSVHIISGHSPLQSLGAMQGLKKSDVFFNYTVHSPFDDELASNFATASRGISGKLACWMAKRVDARNIKMADRVQCDSFYTLAVMKEKHSRVIGQKGVVAPGWVDAKKFIPLTTRQLVRADLGHHWQTDGPIFFTLRRLENRMGLDSLINACDILKRSGFGFRMLIGGGGPMMPMLQQMIASSQLNDCVRLLGRIPEECLASCYAAADCFVLPTKALECFGLIVLEAFACNTPVIASEVAAIPELAERQGRMWLYEPGNAEELANRMRGFLELTLKPSVDLRKVAMEYDKPEVLTRWEGLLQI